MSGAKQIQERKREKEDTLERRDRAKRFASWKCIYCVMYSNGGQPGIWGTHTRAPLLCVGARLLLACTYAPPLIFVGGSSAGSRRVGALQREGRLLPEKNSSESESNKIYIYIWGFVYLPRGGRGVEWFGASTRCSRCVFGCKEKKQKPRCAGCDAPQLAFLHTAAMQIENCRICFCLKGPILYPLPELISGEVNVRLETHIIIQITLWILHNMVNSQ